MKIRELLSETEVGPPLSPEERYAAVRNSVKAELKRRAEAPPRVYVDTSDVAQKTRDFHSDHIANANIPINSGDNDKLLSKNLESKMKYLYKIYKEEGMEGLIYQEMDQNLVTSIVHYAKDFAKSGHSKMIDQFLKIFNDSFVHKITDYVSHMDNSNEA